MIKKTINLSLKLFTLLSPSEKPLLFTGPNSTAKLVKLWEESGYTKPLIVTEKHLVQLGLIDDTIAQFRKGGHDPVIYDGIEPNPTFAVVEAGIKTCKENQCDSIFVIGGGSAIDAAKVIAACVSNQKSVEQVVGLLKIKKPTLPFFAVPTTSGTGSEMTNAAVISETSTHQKKFVVDAKLLPRATALDPILIKSLPPHITATTGMDALTHAIEAYTSLNQYTDAKRDAELAVKLLLTYLPKAYKNGEDLEAREQVALGSFLAGYAFNKSGLGYVHAISHQISAHYNTPHGLANAVILPRVMRFNLEKSAERLAALETMMNSHAKGNSTQLATKFITRIEHLSNTLNIPDGLEEIEEKDYSKIAKNALKEARLFYAVPRTMKPQECNNILKSIQLKPTITA